MLPSGGVGDRSWEVCLPFGWVSSSSTSRVFTKRFLTPPKGCCKSLVNYQERYLIMFGGGSLTFFTNDVFVYDLERRGWSFKATGNSDMVAPRLCHSSVIHRDKMIVYGGQSMSRPVLYDDVLELDLIRWRWSVLQCTPAGAEGPGARTLHCAHVNNDRMYVLMGVPPAPRETPVLYLDLHTRDWHYLSPILLQDVDTTAEPAAMPSLCGCSSAVSGDSIYLFGGYRSVEGEWDEQNLFFNCEYVNSLYEYNMVLNTWRSVSLHPCTPRPAPRYAASVGVHDGYLYLFGGDANQVGVPLYYGDLWRIRVQDGLPTWCRVKVAGAFSPSARSGCAYTCARASLFIVAGEVPLENPPYYGCCPADLFQLPLGYSSQLTLRLTSARWLGTAARGRGETPSLRKKISLTLGAQCALDEYYGG
ncbi:hypothetical protein JKF63_05892 [Porcisia hertigi]|uniref:Uncharacterized protein n=1 Tax=Porcisia hertigi TaxID=2761500 RepID=A0A836LC21_9TRYP|nr:hypothetical protein JKF63_05892 [Porcisia hertigi]